MARIANFNANFRLGSMRFKRIAAAARYRAFHIFGMNSGFHIVSFIEAWFPTKPKNCLSSLPYLHKPSKHAGRIHPYYEHTSTSCPHKLPAPPHKRSTHDDVYTYFRAVFARLRKHMLAIPALTAPTTNPTGDTSDVLGKLLCCLCATS